MKITRITAFFLAMTILLFPVNSQSLKEQVNSLNNPQIKGKLDTSEIQIGNLSVTSDSFYTVEANNEKCGLVIENDGEFSLKIKDKYCISVCERNAKKWHIDNNIQNNGLKITKRFKKAFILTTAYGFNYKEQAATESFPQNIKEFIEKNEHIDPGIDIEAAKLRNNDLTVAVFETTLGYFYYVFDPDNTESEKLYYLRKSKYTELYEMFEIAYQPIDREVYETTLPDFKVTKLNLNVTNTKGDDAEIQAILTVKPEKKLNGVSFNLLNSFYIFNKNTREVSEKRFLNTESVTVNGQSVDYIHQTNRLLVKIPNNDNGEFTLTVKLKGNILEHPNGDNFWKLGKQAWYPKALLKEEQAITTIKATVPKDYEVFASGDTLSLSKKGDYKTIETALTMPIQRPMVTAGKYFIHKQNALGRTCTVATHGTKKKKTSKKLISYFFAASDILSKAFNKPYPFKDQYIIETNFRKYDEGPSIIFVGKDIFNPKNEASEKINLNFIQKISRAFWRYKINIPNKNELWIAESFSEYSAALTYQNLFRKRKIAEKKFKKIIRMWKRGTELVTEGSSVYLAGHISRKKKKDLYDKLHLLYDKGPFVLHALRLEMEKKYGAQNGDRMFFIWMSSILKSFNGRYVNTYDCIRLLNMITKDNWMPFFDKYIFGDQTPKINI